MRQERDQVTDKYNKLNTQLRIASAFLICGGFATSFLGVAENANHHTEQDDQHDIIATLIKRNPQAQDDLLYYEPYLTYQNEVPDYFLIGTGVTLILVGGVGSGLSATFGRKPEASQESAGVTE